MDIVEVAAQREAPRRIVSALRSQRALFGGAALVFVVSAVVTIVWSASMSTMGGMPMESGWTMSMMWMRMPGQTWLGLAASFVGMWVVMMTAMMMPSLVPMLLRYRRAVHAAAGTRLAWLTLIVGAGYLFIWTIFGTVVFALGVMLATAEMAWPAVSRAVPLANALALLVAGAVQFTPWKMHHLICCRQAPARGSALRPDTDTAWRHGLRLGLHCSYCSLGLTAVLLVVGVMDLRAMAVVTIAITAERLAPGGVRVAHGIGAIVIAAGLWLIVSTGLLG